MDCTLMHKNIEVLELVIDEEAVAITKLGKIHEPEHLPLGVLSLKGGIDRREMNEWLWGRSIPASRSGIWDLYTRLGRASTEYLILECYGLSLSDHYWICPKNSGLIWTHINFFQNDFSKDVGEILFGNEPEDAANINLVSPDNTSDGWLRKKWIIADGKRVLVKGGSGAWKQEPYNEAIASAIMRCLGVSHVPYTVMTENDEPFSLCENFLTVDTELVSAWRVLNSRKMDDRDSDFTHLLKCCDALNIPNAESELKKMIAIDYIIANEDRHYTNFGFVRNVETLEWLGVAPIFDCGTSLWYNSARVGAEVPCKPFRKHHIDQLKLVDDFSWFDKEKIAGIEEDMKQILWKSAYVDEQRGENIIKAVLNRTDAIEKLAHGSSNTLL